VTVAGVHHLIVPSNPTPNGDLHVGHLAGPYLGADVLRRAAHSRGEGASVLLGTAWQNTHVMLAVRRQGRDYLEVAADFAGQIESSFAAAGIGYDVMLRHADIPDIERATRLAWQRLRTDGAIVVRDAAAQHCDRCERWRFQGYVEGRCPHCGSTDAAGIDCEGCGLYHDDAELLDAVCAECGTATTPRPLRRAFLDLEAQRAWLEPYLAATQLTPAVRAFAQTVLAGPLPPVALTFVGELGIPVNDAELPGQRIYPAFELAPRYGVMLDRLRAAGVDPGPEPWTSMIFGYDNAFERVFLFPAVLRALGPVPFPRSMLMTFFYLLDGLKFSTSRRHLVGVHELVRAHGADAVRLYLAATRPEDGTTDFSRSACAGSAQVAAVAELQRWARTGLLPTGAAAAGGTATGGTPLAGGAAAGRAADGGTLAGGATLAGAAGGGWERLVGAAAVLHEAMTPGAFSCVRAAGAVLELVALARGGDGDASVAAEALECLVNGAAPLIPQTAALLGAAFAVPPRVFDGRVAGTAGTGGRRAGATPEAERPERTRSVREVGG